jgi:kynureninase
MNNIEDSKQTVSDSFNFDISPELATEMDHSDKLRHFRNEFWIPKHTDGEESIYFCGNSLGLQPKQTKDYLNQELEDWKDLGVEGHFKGQNPWVAYHEYLTEKMAKVVGAKPIEVVTMNTLSANLHFLMASFYRPTSAKYKILIESDAFPSDRYAVQSQANFHGYNPEDAIIEMNPREGEDLLRMEDIEKTIKENGDEIALILLGGVNYYTGQYFDLKKITEWGHQKNSMVGFDLAHAAGNVPVNLHESEADFAAWCTYKYLNSGPGSIAAIFVHERHANNKDLPRFAGWWGHNMETRFNMRQPFDPIPGAEGWQLSNPPILSLAAIRSSLDLFEKAGMENLREKSLKLTAYLEFLLHEIKDERIKIITPRNPEERGCQLSIQLQGCDKKLFDLLTEGGMIADWREPDVIRVAPVPLYNSYQDCYRFYNLMKNCLNKC